MSVVKVTKQSFVARIHHGLKWRYNRVRSITKRFVRLKVVVRFLYWWNSRKPIQDNKVIFFETSSAGISNSFSEIFNELVRNYEMDVHCHFLMIGKVGKWEELKRQMDFVKDAATAKYILLNDSNYLFGQMKKRKGQHFMNTWHGCGAFKRFGFGVADKIFGDSEKIMRKYPLHPEYDLFTTSSPEVTWAYVESIGAEKHPECVQGIGVSRTDVFYRKEFIDQAFIDFYAEVPQAKNKKVILYAPTFRGRVRKGTTPNMLNLSMFYENFSDEYVLVYKYHPFSKDSPQIDPIYKDFAFDLTSMEIETLLCVADICISDYSSLIFEYSLFEKPLIFFAYDLNNYFDWRGFYYSYEELAPGPICYTNNEMVDYIQNIDTQFDKAKVQAFRKKFMSTCDGQATKRIMKTFFADEIEPYRRKDALRGDYHFIPTTERFRQYQETLDYYLILKKKARKAYENARQKPIMNKKIALMVDEHTSTAVFHAIKKLLKKHDYTIVEDIDIHPDTVRDYVGQLADVEIILCAGEPYILRMLDLRPETKIIQICPEILPGYPKWNNTMEVKSRLHLTESYELPIHTAYDGIMSTVKGFDELYARNYMLKPGGKMIHCGNLQADMLFSDSSSVRERLEQLVPTAKDKKIILLVWQKRDGMRRLLNETLTKMHEMFARDYICIVDSDDNGMVSYKVPGYLQGYAVNLLNELERKRSEQAKMLVDDEASNEVSEETDGLDFNTFKPFSRLEELVAADIVITDYCSDTFAVAATGKPLILWTPDYRSYMNSHETYLNFDQMLPECRVEESDDLIQALADIEHYDYKAERRFADACLQKCDGKSAKYLLEYLKAM